MRQPQAHTLGHSCSPERAPAPSQLEAVVPASHVHREQLAIDLSQSDITVADQIQGPCQQVRLPSEPDQREPPVQKQALAQDPNQHGGPECHQDQPGRPPVMSHEMDPASLDFAFDFDLLDFPATAFVGVALDTHTDLPALSPKDLLNQFVSDISPNSQIPRSGAHLENQKLPPSIDHAAQITCPSVGDSSDDPDYAGAVVNLQTYYPDNAKSTFHFPSNRIVYRFVDAFFRHMAPHMPILHQPTFSIASTPCKYVFKYDEKY